MPNTIKCPVCEGNMIVTLTMMSADDPVDIDALKEECIALKECLDALGRERDDLLSLLRECRAAIEALDVNALGIGSEVVTLENGLSDLLTWSLRDELIDNLNKVLHMKGDE